MQMMTNVDPMHLTICAVVESYGDDVFICRKNRKIESAVAQLPSAARDEDHHRKSVARQSSCCGSKDIDAQAIFALRRCWGVEEILEDFKSRAELFGRNIKLVLQAENQLNEVVSCR